MKMLLDIQGNDVQKFMEVVKSFAGIKAKQISNHDAELFTEIKHIKKAFKDSEKVKDGKLKVRPASNC